MIGVVFAPGLQSHTEFPHSGSGRLEGASAVGVASGGPNAQHIPDVVSSSQSDALYSPQLTHQQSSQLNQPPPMGAGAMGPPHRPPRRKKRDNYPSEVRHTSSIRTRFFLTSKV